ncbi:hypothetical protein KFK09_000699 [Dendrobium nobile]|uniref:Uncharacterized protein n=1 Tax=Dendrobium nobile TaxID=94219 RepID=A0A8T3CDT6_DENNO|nr:hypothetical protein KFK09_000699 [Dendrobium nobile]
MYSFVYMNFIFIRTHELYYTRGANESSRARVKGCSSRARLSNVELELELELESSSKVELELDSTSKEKARRALESWFELEHACPRPSLLARRSQLELVRHLSSVVCVKSSLCRPSSASNRVCVGSGSSTRRLRRCLCRSQLELRICRPSAVVCVAVRIGVRSSSLPRRCSRVRHLRRSPLSLPRRCSRVRQPSPVVCVGVRQSALAVRATRRAIESSNPVFELELN